MKMMKNQLALALGLASVMTFAIGCESDAPESRSTATPGLNPIQNYKHQVMHDATVGLRYAHNRVAVDLEADRRLEPNTQQAAAMYEQGTFHLGDHNNFLGAIRAYSDAVMLDPTDAQHYVGLGRALDYKGSPSKAEAAYRTALDLDMRNLEAHELLARNLSGKGQAAESITEWNRVLVLNPDHADAHGYLASIHYLNGNYSDAMDHLNDAERLGYPAPARLRSALEAHLVNHDQ